MDLAKFGVCGESGAWEGGNDGGAEGRRPREARPGAEPSFPPSQAERPEPTEDAGQTPEDLTNLSSGGQSAGQTDEEPQIPDSWTDFG